MANEYTEFLRNFRNSYIVVQTESSEVWRPFFVREMPERGDADKTVIGYLLHEPTSKEKREGINVSYKESSLLWKNIQGKFNIVTPESCSVNLQDVCVYLHYVPRRQFVKGWQPQTFRHTALWGGNSIRPIGASRFDTIMEASYFALANGKNYLSPREVIKQIEAGDRISCAFSRNFALGWQKGVYKPALYHRGQMKGVFAGQDTFEVLEDCMKFKDLFKKNWGFELKQTDAKDEGFSVTATLDKAEDAPPAGYQALGDPGDYIRMTDRVNAHRVAPLEELVANRPPPILVDEWIGNDLQTARQQVREQQFANIAEAPVRLDNVPPQLRPLRIRRERPNPEALAGIPRARPRGT